MDLVPFGTAKIVLYQQYPKYFLSIDLYEFIMQCTDCHSSLNDFEVYTGPYINILRPHKHFSDETHIKCIKLMDTTSPEVASEDHGQKVARMEIVKRDRQTNDEKRLIIKSDGNVSSLDVFENDDPSSIHFEIHVAHPPKCLHKTFMLYGKHDSGTMPQYVTNICHYITGSSPSRKDDVEIYQRSYRSFTGAYHLDGCEGIKYLRLLKDPHYDAWIAITRSDTGERLVVRDDGQLHSLESIHDFDQGRREEIEANYQALLNNNHTGSYDGYFRYNDDSYKYRLKESYEKLQKKVVTDFGASFDIHVRVKGP